MTAIELVLFEMERSAIKYGYTDEHIVTTPEDYDNGELAYAAAAYCLSDKWVAMRSGCFADRIFPWDEMYFKPSDDRIRELTKAAAMLIREITRLQTLQNANKEPETKA